MSLGRLVSANVLVRSTTRNAARFHPTLRMFPTHNAHALKPRSSVIVGLGSIRSLSFWRSTPVPAPSSPPEPVTSGISSQSDFFAEATPILESASIPEAVASLHIPSTLAVPPLNYGDLAALGFSHWTPAGLAQWSLELIQVASGMPWFWAIVAATVLSRVIVIPLNISALRTSARLAPYQPRLMRLREELEKTGGLNKDPIAVQRISLQQKQIYEEAGASLIAPIATPFIQIPVSVGLFIGIKRLCDFPLEQLKVGGFGWITDLTVPDPTFMLPLAMMVLVNVQISIGAKDITKDGAQTMHLFNLLKAVAVVSAPFMAYLPAGVMVYLLTGVVAMTIQSLVLRAPSIRKALDIPVIPDDARLKPPTFIETVKVGIEWWKKKGEEARAQQRAQQRRKF